MQVHGSKGSTVLLITRSSDVAPEVNLINSLHNLKPTKSSKTVAWDLMSSKNYLKNIIKKPRKSFCALMLETYCPHQYPWGVPLVLSEGERGNTQSCPGCPHTGSGQDLPRLDLDRRYLSHGQDLPRHDLDRRYPPMDRTYPDTTRTGGTLSMDRTGLNQTGGTPPPEQTDMYKTLPSATLRVRAVTISSASKHYLPPLFGPLHQNITFRHSSGTGGNNLLCIKRTRSRSRLTVAEMSVVPDRDIWIYNYRVNK